MKAIRGLFVVLSVFAPFLLVAYAFAQLPHALQFLRQFDSIDWMWLMLLGLMMLGIYHFLAVFLLEENGIQQDFDWLDADHDGYIRAQDAAGWTQLARVFDRFDSDHDGRLSRVEFEQFEHSLPR